MKTLETVQDCYFYQNVKKTTRSRGTDTATVIDLIFTNEELELNNLEYHSPLGKSDHSVLTFNYNCYLDYSAPKDKYSYGKADYTSMRNELETTNWTANFLIFAENRPTEELWQRFKTDILKLRDSFVPKVKQGSTNWKNKNSIPISKTLREAIHKKRVLHRRWISHKGHSDTARETCKNTGIKSNH